LITVFQSIIEVVILCAAGYILARAGILDKPTQRKLNVVNGESWPDHSMGMPLG
jgi:predicted permease